MELLSRPAAMAVPKYRPDCAAAAPSVLAAASAFGMTITAPSAPRAATEPAISVRTRNERDLVATRVSFLGDASGIAPIAATAEYERRGIRETHQPGCKRRTSMRSHADTVTPSKQHLPRNYRKYQEA
ncbi:hypothetical protein Aca07nite_59540 [Actinoplanes capillaceus]|uniref:Uncharacterized protein n=1 Tax=Actinoplanes campanulatus TaxID=113559 RepID=A0ABQ3WQZ7_9ACTN|nr:hypothetical protein Aca07nite_59540 [Actinoplanes capillaceus]